MTLKAHRFLGLAVEEQGVQAAEVRIVGGRCELVRAGEFAFPAGLSLADPAPLGKALRQFLRENRFSATRAVLGIPAGWLMAKEKDVPPAPAEAVAGILRMQAERDFSSEPADLVIDYADGADSGGAGPVLLVAALRRKTDQVAEMARAAGLKALSLTASAMALASAAGRSQSAAACVLWLRPHHGELTLRVGGRFRVVRHLPLDGGPGEGRGLEGLADQVRRLVSLLPGTEASTGPETLVIWNGSGLSPDALRGVGERLSMKVEPAEGLSALRITKTCFPGEEDGTRFAAAAALALAGARSKPPAVDFLHSRLAAKKKRMALGRRAVWAAILAVALAVAGTSLLLDWQWERRDVAALRDRLEEMDGDIRAARSMTRRVSLARRWYDRTPRLLDCLRGLTLAFPAEGSIWTTSLGLREDMRGIVSGKSVDERTVLEVLDTMKARDDFSDVKLLYMRGADRGSREVSFAISFAFLGGE